MLITVNTTTSRPPVPSILQILTTFYLYSGRPKTVLQSTVSKRSDKQWLRFQGGGNVQGFPWAVYTSGNLSPIWGGDNTLMEGLMRGT